MSIKVDISPSYDLKAKATGMTRIICTPSASYDLRVTARVSNGTVPVFVSAVVENATPTKVVLTYDQTLDESSVPATTDFTLPGKTISGVSIVGSTVEVTVSVAYEYGDVITIDYTAGANPIQGATGGPDADSLADAPVTNNIVDTSIIPYVNGFEWTDDDSDGYGNGWSKRPGGLGSGSIVTGNGFTGNAQRFTHVSGAISRLQYVTVLSTAIGATYRLRGKYRAGAGSWRIYLTGTTQPFTFDMGDNIGDAIEFDYSLTTTAIATIILTFYKAFDLYGSALADDYIEIDEIRLHKL